MRKIVIILALGAMLLSTSSCGSFSKLSYDDAYNIGYGIGYYGTKMLNN